MDLTKFLGQDSQEQSAQRLSKEEYAAQKKQEREEIWGMIDGKAQEVFQNGDSLKGFLGFYGTVQAAEDRQPVPALCTESGDPAGQDL